jgi:cobalt/nickel transport system permease protein
MNPSTEQTSWLSAVDPRVRLVLGLGLCLLTALLQTVTALAFALALSVMLCVAARTPARVIFRRVAGLNILLAIALPFLLLDYTPGDRSPVGWNAGGFYPALAIWLKGHSLILWTTSLISTIETGVLGHALAHLRLPDKLIHLYLFTVRYLRLMRSEHERIQRAARARGFVARANRHTYRTLASMTGWLLVKSLDRSERVMAAMKCRGFDGRFYLLDHFHAAPRDAIYLVMGIGVMAGLGWLEWS